MNATPLWLLVFLFEKTENSLLLQVSVDTGLLDHFSEYRGAGTRDKTNHFLYSLVLKGERDFGGDDWRELLLTE